jgi:hypothetical protein
MDVLEELEHKYDITLPSKYKEWYQSGGQKSESLIGTDVDVPRLYELQEWAKELLEEDQSNFLLPKNSFVFAMHQGYQFMYFICNESSDPEVWYYFEGDKEPKVKWKSFSDFIRNT